MAYPTYDPNNGIVHDVNKNVGFSDRFTPQTWNDTSWYGDSVPGLNLVNLPRKDTITVPKFGYTVIRFRADNPGFWFMHCHVETHAQLGMTLVLQVGEPEVLPPIPDGLPMCGHVYKNQVSGISNSGSSDIKLQNFKDSVDKIVDTSRGKTDESRETLRTSENTEVIYTVFLIALLVISLVQFAYIFKLRFRRNGSKLRGTPLHEYNERKQLLDHSS